ncbi:hypothetical protein ACPOLB_01610 [Rubrivivax sp. RP6-9]|uniref:hypothetical protein n=1 Tax=Rubrivivax sp. RP6-9 TaxID=3415750 RepID=UPI003CC6417F
MGARTTPLPACTLHAVAALVCLAASLLAWLLFFVQYWPYRALFDEQGLYFDAAAGVVVRSQSAMLVVPALGLLLLALMLALLGRRKHRRQARP